MTDDDVHSEIPGQQAFDIVPAGAAAHPPRSRRRQVIAGGTALITGLAFAGWGVTDALGSSPGAKGFPQVATLSASTTASTSTSSNAAVKRAVVDILATDHYSGEADAGTGMVITSNGDVLTNNHVVSGSTSLTVTLTSTGKTYRATVLGTDAADDVALIKLKGASGLSTIPVGDATKVTTGMAVSAIGNALGKAGAPTVTTGTITGTGRSITASDGDGSASEKLTGLLETDADIVSGDSGGPLVDTSGQVIGMDTAASTSGSGDGAFGSSTITSSDDGYAIPITTALAIASQIAAGHASSSIVIGVPGFLGVELSGSGSTGGTSGSTGGYGGGLGGEYGEPPATGGYGSSGYGGYGTGGSAGSAIGTAYSSTSGVTVAGVVSGSPAADAGLVAGDVITAVNGTTVSGATALSALLDKTHGGDSMTVTWTTASGTSQHATIHLIDGPAA